MTEKLKEIISDSNNIVFFGGAGVSTESNIPDFRSENGIYNAINNYGLSPEKMLSHTFFVKYPERFFDYYKNNLIFPDAKPNKAHLALAKLEKEGKLKGVITQNIDNLHQSAGSINVCELHGSVYRNYCMGCHKEFNLEDILNSKEAIPYCDKCGSIIKPDVVLYEEALNDYEIERAIKWISQADTLIVGGTSLSVYPAAGLIDYFRGDNLVLINKSSTSYDRKANLIIKENIGEVLGNVMGI